MNSKMNLDTPVDADTNVGQCEAAKTRRSAKKTRQAVQEETFDKRRAEKRKQARRENITYAPFQERQKVEGRRKQAQRLGEEAASKGLLTQRRLEQDMFDLLDHLKSNTVALPATVSTQP